VRRSCDPSRSLTVRSAEMATAQAPALAVRDDFEAPQQFATRP